MPGHTYGVTYVDLEPYMLAAGSLAAYASAILLYASEAGGYVDKALDKVGYDPDEVSGRDPTDQLYELCKTVVALRCACSLVNSTTLQDTSIAASLYARSEEQVKRIESQPHAVSRDTYDSKRNGVRVALKPLPRPRFWVPGRKT